MADLRDLESLRSLTERAATDTEPPVFADLVSRARSRRRRRSAAAGGLVAAAVVGTVVAGAALRGPAPGTGGPTGPDLPVASDPAGTTSADPALPPPDAEAVAVVEAGTLYNYDVDAQGDLLSVWVSCPDTSSCRYAWRLVRADGEATAGLYPALTGGPHVSAGDDYFVATWYTGPRLLVDADGRTSRLRPPDREGRDPAPLPGAATALTTDGVRLVDRAAGRWLSLASPTGRDWNDVEVADDGTVWGVDQPLAGERATVSWLTPGGDWHPEPLVGPGAGTLARAGDHVAALALDASGTPDGRGSAPSFGEPSDYAVTTDGGRTWTHRDPADLPVTSFESWAASPDGTLFVSDGRHVYRSTDDTWLRFERVAGADGLNRLQGGDATHPDRVLGYSYDDDRLVAVDSRGGSDAEAAEDQLR